MKNKLNLHIDLNSPSNKRVKTPDILRKRDYSPMPIDSPNSIKHRISVIDVEETKNEVKKEMKNIKKEKEKENENEKYKHK